MKLETTQDIITGASKHHAVPLWPQMVKFNPPAPNPKCVPHIWRYDEVRPYLVRAGELVKEKDAERRVLMLVNPARGETTIHSLVKWKRYRKGLLIEFQKDHIRPTHYMLVCNSSCRMKRRLRIDIRLLLCGL